MPKSYLDEFKHDQFDKNFSRAFKVGIFVTIVSVVGYIVLAAVAIYLTLKNWG